MYWVKPRSIIIVLDSVSIVRLLLAWLHFRLATQDGWADFCFVACLISVELTLASFTEFQAVAKQLSTSKILQKMDRRKLTGQEIQKKTTFWKQLVSKASGIRGFWAWVLQQILCLATIPKFVVPTQSV